MSKKQTKQSRATKRRKLRQAAERAAGERKASAFGQRRPVLMPLQGMELAAAEKENV